ncbi:bifunctional [glutamine synthetase] adenylyltransferase/[glutamine synthetase]-adenylyl-L-tyrosine phosphorylase [Pseudorhodoplanes sp.]|uniref:bifunctional [glutamine synthetase] adenylyltransferase/[glutamine synthetase]-adenylyl-L-tyrosine phosphorylase n=1 Tax=Pseudorhodoplanes sp. TaxID=1934341 RepID=UPI002B758D53|nr:bifunctional [glutamine synthetase] adenylyltransferase/[glutamine synthetase]-adenylyl-L-tyrosine phosphorylase [Pseudorhodoplanes sp.]HWV54038.1 bifunctional [glutamine synthetase] adenylyltransferase/[glutamine synthetase]-adenylyl-L-tyrosine phosphorylase [Pseudorhodoplanes sp.]
MSPGSVSEESVRDAGGALGTLATRIVEAPCLPQRDQSLARLDDWTAGLELASDRDALHEIFAASPMTRDLIAGLLDYSPYLTDLVRADPGRLTRLLRANPESHIEALLTNVVDALSGMADEAEAMQFLRRTKAEAALLIAIADIGGVWPVLQVTRALTDLADRMVQGAVRFLLNEAVRRGRLTPADPGHPERGSGYIVLAMGKMGAFELNYSSDIDLIVFYDPEAPAIPADSEPSALYIRVTRGLVKLLQERTPDGYVFRVDLRLRPDPASTQVAISVPAGLDYYEHRGQNWERSAMIKARPCAGDIEAGEKLLKALSPFVWRKYMDFAALADIHAMKRQIHAYRGHGEIAVAGHNIKLGRGGIREIEFFVQTQQLIAGGRHPELRDLRTLTTLAALADGQWVSGLAQRELEAAYLFLRRAEHRLQMTADEQTHTLPSDEAELLTFARFLGYDSTEAFSDVLLLHLRNVQQHYSRLFEPVVQAPEAVLQFPEGEDSRDTLDRLAAMGFRNPLEISALVRNWLNGRYPALRSEFARSQLRLLTPSLIEQLARSENREQAVLAFDRFLSGLHATGGARLISLLLQNPDLLALVALMLGTAPRLADILSHQPQVMDALIDPAFFGALPNAETLASELARSLDQSVSYEDRLDRLRLFGQEHMFLIGVRILSGTVSAEQAGEAFARLADVIIRALHAQVETMFAQSYGRIREQKTALLALGKLGGREMTASSDLDLILVYDFDDEHPESDGERPLYGAQYFARLTKRLVSALTSQTNYGALYHVDMRLRPSGRSGPVATKLDSFRDYQMNEAWTWEHMALTRARVVSASQGFGEKVGEMIRSVLAQPRDAGTIAGDAYEMRMAIATERGEADRWDLKYAAGGLIDIEFIAQYLQLVHADAHPDILDPSTARVLERAARLGLLSAEDSEVLRPAVHLYQNLSQILRLCLSGPFDPKKTDPGLLRLLARAADVPDFATLDAHVAETQERVRKRFEALLGPGE